MKAQSEVVRFVFEGCNIIYCKHNIMMDIERNWNMTNYSLIKSAYDMLKYRIEEKEYKRSWKIGRRKFQNIIKKWYKIISSKYCWSILS